MAQIIVDSLLALGVGILTDRLIDANKRLKRLETAITRWTGLDIDTIK